MKISKETIEILKNFSLMNPSIYIREGNVIETIASVSKAVRARAEVKENFPMDFAIYDLGNFLNALNFFKECSLEFEKDNVLISDSKDNSKMIRYYFSNPEHVIYPENKVKVNKKNNLLSFDLKEEYVEAIYKSAKMFKFEKLSFETFGKDLYFTEFSSSHYNKLSTKIYEFEEEIENFNLVMSIVNFAIIKTDYVVTVMNKKNKDGEVEGLFLNFSSGNGIDYWIAMENESKIFIDNDGE